MSLFSLQINWVDLVILFVLGYFIVVGWTVGFWSILADFLSFLFSLLIALSIYQYVAEVLRNNFNLSYSTANALGFLLVAIVLELILNYIFNKIIEKIPFRFWKKRWDSFLATLPALGEGLVLIAFVLTLLIALPSPPKIKADIAGSRIGGTIVQKTSGIEANITDIFGGVVEDSLTYLTVKPGSSESIQISVDSVELSVDDEAEQEMLKLLNSEREKAGIRKLTWRDESVLVARVHAVDMWDKSYFGHVSPEGSNVGHRLENANVGYTAAGENLALAPTVKIAHQGLMNSEGHRENILDKRFNRVGIGVVDNGVHGKMFVQVFTN